MRAPVLVGVLSISISFAAPAMACETNPCADLATHVVPANTPAIAFNLTPETLLDAQLVIGGSGSELVGDLLIPHEPLVFDGGHHGYGVNISDNCSRDASFPSEWLEVVAAAPLPSTPLGDVTVGPQVMRETLVSLLDCNDCTGTVHGATRSLRLDLPDDAKPWSALIALTLDIDDAGYSLISSRIEHGRRPFARFGDAADGSVELTVYSTCSDADAGFINGLPQGTHVGVVHAQLAGTSTVLASNAFSFDLQCGGQCDGGPCPKAKIPPVCGAFDAGEPDSGTTQPMLDGGNDFDAGPGIDAGASLDAGRSSFDAGADAGTPTTPTTPEGGCGGCSSGPSLLAMSALALIFRRRRITIRVPLNM